MCHSIYALNHRKQMIYCGNGFTTLLLLVPAEQVQGRREYTMPSDSKFCTNFVIKRKISYQCNDILLLVSFRVSPEQVQQFCHLWGVLCYTRTQSEKCVLEHVL